MRIDTHLNGRRNREWTHMHLSVMMSTLKKEVTDLRSKAEVSQRKQLSFGLVLHQLE